MKKILLSIFLFAAGGICAQEADIPCTVKKSSVFKDEFKNSAIVSVDEDASGGMVVARSYQGGLLNARAHGYYFEHYDANMNLLKDFEYELKDGYVIGLIVKEDQVHIIDFTYDKKKKVYTCNANSASLSNFQFTTKELFSIEREEVKSGRIYSFGSGDNDSWVNMIVNQNKTAFGISLDIDDKEDRNEMRRLYVYDSGLNLKIKHDFKRDIKDRKFKYENIDISEDGTVAYLLGKAKTTEGKKKKEGGRYEYELTRITQNDSKTQAFDTEEHYARSLKPVFKKGKIACVGFYSDRSDNRFKGLCYFDMDPETLKISTSKFTPFSSQFMIDKYGKDKEKELKNVSFRNVFLTDKNEIVFNAEEFYVTVHHNMGPNGQMMGVTYIYHYDDIVSAKLADNGDLVWARNINKRQATSGTDSYISYTSMVKGDDTYFFINTGEKVRKLRNDRIQFGQKSPNRSNLNIIRINQAGDMEYKEILDDKDNEVPFMVSDGAITKGGGSVYFIGRKGRKKQMLKLSL